MIETPILVVIVLLVIATSEFTRGLIRKLSLDSGRLATVQLIRQAKPDLTPLSTESTITFCGSYGALSGKRDCVRKSAEKAARRALQWGRLSSTEVRPLPGEIAICRASLLEHAVLLRGVCERLLPAALSRDATENTCARLLWAILEGGELKLEKDRQPKEMWPRSILPHQLRQLGDIRLNPPRESDRPVADQNSSLSQRHKAQAVA
jgi:hypothetical protein